VTALAAYLLAALPHLPIPLGVRLLAALTGLVLVPGWALLRLTQRPPGGRLLAAGWAAGMGVAWNGALVLAAGALHADFRSLVWVSPLLAVVLWIIVWLRPVPAEPAGPRWTRATTLWLCAALAIAVIHGARMGTPFGYYTDSPDHIGTVRRMMLSGDPFPRDAFFADAGERGADPRKGLWHPIVALVCLAGRADAFDGWVGLAAWMGPLLLLNMAALGFLAGGPTVATLAAWALLLTLGGSLADQYFREAVFSTRLGDSLALAAGTALAADLQTPSTRARAAAVLLAVGAVFTHVYYALQLALVAAALGLSLLASREDRGRLGRWFVTAACVGGACLPYVLLRAPESAAPHSTIHTAPQGLLYLTDRVRVVSPGVLWDWLGLLWLALPFLLVWVWRHRGGRPAWHLIAVSGTAPLALMFVPPLVDALQPSLGYLLMRMVWMIPLAALIALALTALARALRGGGSRRMRAAAWLAVLLALAAPSVADSVQVLLRPRAFRDEERAHSMLPWRDALAWMSRHLPAGTVVLADPVTSYSIPMMTGLHVVTLEDQHSSPNDTGALQRILDARDALDPHARWARTLEVLRGYHVGAIALNARFVRPVGLDYWAPYPGFFDRVRARFDPHPRLFPVLFDSAGFVVYGVRAPLPDSLPETAGEPPWLVDQVPAGAVAIRDTADVFARMLALEFLAPPGPEPALGRGDTLRAALYWRPEREQPPGQYSVAVRFDDESFAPPAALRWAAKPYRKWVESRRGERFRFRQEHLPGEGEFNVDRWPAGRIVRDPFVVPVPTDIVPGTYLMKVRMLAPPGHYPNFRLSDYFSDDDYYSGLPVARVRITAEARR
jgi:hypothetical protein